MSFYSFYGKDGNYAFCFSKDGEYKVVMSKAKNQMDVKESMHFEDVDSCVLWAAYRLFFSPDKDYVLDKITILSPASEPVMEFITTDALLEAAWKTLTDVNIDDDECIEQNWFVFEAGTFREDIWHWFDEHHSKGVGWLINEYE